MPTFTTFLPRKLIDRPTNMLNDDCLPGITWAHLEQAFQEVASPANRALVRNFVTQLWEDSNETPKGVKGFLPETHQLVNILVAILLAGPGCFPGSADGPATPS